jgi:hypothetical protein
MNGLIRKAGLFTLGALFLAGVAAAGVPQAGNSSIGTGIPLGAGSTSGGVQGDVDNGIEVVSPAAARTFTIRDANNIAVTNVAVTIDFSACTTGEFRLCGTQTGAGITIDCTARTITATTNGLGQVTFAVAGHSNGTPALNTPCATVSSLGQPLGTLRVSAYDDGSGGITGSDLGRVLSDRSAYIASTANYRMRSDFDGDGDVDGGDLGAMLSERAATIATGQGAFSCAGGVTCP